MGLINTPHFDYQIKRNSKRKHLGLFVENQKVEVRAPQWASEAEIKQWVISKEAWVLKQLRNQHLQASEKPDIRNNGSILFFGQYRPIQIILGRSGVFENGEALLISHQPQHNPQRILENWLKQEAGLYIKERCQELADKMGLLQAIRRITLRKTKSKWGHCTASGQLQFNWLIIMAPTEVIDYLLIHELCHLVHMNHSSDFWQLVNQYCPDYKQHKSWLMKNGHKIWL